MKRTMTYERAQEDSDWAPRVTLTITKAEVLRRYDGAGPEEWDMTARSCLYEDGIVGSAIYDTAEWNLRRR